MTPEPEFSRPVSVGAQSGAQDIEADVEERAALAERFDLVSLDHLAASLDLAPDGDALIVTGQVTAQLEQACIITGDPVSASIEEPLNLRFLPENEAPDAEELELEEDDCETLFYDGGSIDLGEAVAQTMALSLDPFPKSANADAEAREAGVLQEEDVVPDSPFAALKGLQNEDGA